MNFNCFLDKLQLKFGRIKMMENVVLISFNSSSSTKSNLNINWPQPSYSIIFFYVFLCHNGFLIFG
jgi:hypothetical protein